jgi:hypothetical protein
VSSAGQDPGADLVHLQGCDITISGLVESFGSAHQPAAPNNCDSVNDGLPGEVIRPDKPANSSACVEIWARNLTITPSAEISADTGLSGGSDGIGWIDLFASNNINLNGDANAPYLVHANGLIGTNDDGGLVTVKARDGSTVLTGLAIQANATNPGGDGGTVVVQAGGNVNFGSSSTQARGATGGGGVPTGGSISARAFTGSLTGSLPGELNTDAQTDGTVTLQRCIGGVLDYGGTVIGTLNTPANACAPATPSFEPYVVLSNCAVCAPPPPQTRITLVKIIDNTGGGTAVLSDFQLTAAPGVTGTSGTPQVTNVTVAPGAYTLSETTVPGYTASPWVCAGGTQGPNNVITLAVGDNATCTITNTFQPTHLTLVKQFNNAGGGTAAATDWTLTATGPTTISGATGSVAVTNALVTPGVYTLTETGPAGYTAGPWNCTAGTLVGNQLTLAAGQTATCTIINTFQPTRLTLIKQINNAGGGTAVLADFTLFAGAPGPTPISGISGTAAVTNALVGPGTYTLSETIVANYSARAWVCVGGTQVAKQITLAAGQSATCTITNTFNPQQAPQTQLTLVKRVVNTGGGTALPTAWTLTATGPTTISGTTGSPAVTAVIVSPGVYTLTETGPAGYTASAWSCAGGTLVGNQLTLAVGDNATCTIVNTFVPPVVQETCPPGTVPASINQTRVGVTQQLVCNPPPTPTPTGTVQAATSRPRITLPPTDTGFLPTSSNSDGGLGVILVLLAGIAAIVPILVRAGQKGARVAAQSEAPRRPTTWTPRPRPTDSTTPRRKRDGR